MSPLYFYDLRAANKGAHRTQTRVCFADDGNKAQVICYNKVLLVLISSNNDLGDLAIMIEVLHQHILEIELFSVQNSEIDSSEFNCLVELAIFEVLFVFDFRVNE